MSDEIACEECDNCKHSPAYHDGDGGRPCRAWSPDESTDQTTDNFCKCPGWKKTVVKIENRSEDKT